MNKVAETDIEHLAKLARLHLSSEEIKRLGGELGEILNYVGKVNQLAAKVSDKPETAPALLRADKVVPFPDADLLLRSAETDDNKLISVPPVFG